MFKRLFRINKDACIIGDNCTIKGNVNQVIGNSDNGWIGKKKKITNPLESIMTTVLTTSRDISHDKEMAWLFLIVSHEIYNDQELFNNYLGKFGWQNERERLIQLNKNFQLLLNKTQEFVNAENNEWISVDKRMPPYFVDVLVFNGYCIDIARTEKFHEGGEVVTAFENEDITHWQPMPKTPKG